MSTFLQQDPLEQRVLVPKHQAFVGGASMALLYTLQGIFILFELRFQLFDILCATLTKGSLSLPISLLTFFRRSIDLFTQC